jgi:mono/diheme cytochrome c family protein
LPGKRLRVTDPRSIQFSSPKGCGAFILPRVNKSFFQIKLVGAFVLIAALGLSVSQAGLFSKSKPVAPPVPTNPPPPVVVAPPPPPPVVTNTPPPAPPVLAWDADMKEYHAKMGDPTANVSFYLTNTSPVDAVVNSVTTSCGCTTAHLPPMPWTIKPGESGKIDASVNLAGKSGTLIKTLTVNSTAGNKILQVRVYMPDPQVERAQNMELAKGDRQAVFKNNCVTCHVTPGEGKKGAELYTAVCGVCHESPNRGTMVADLHNLKHPTDRTFWKTWITSGKPDSLMPAFSKGLGGPLSDEQIDSLAEYLVHTIPSFDPNASSAH